MKKLFIAIIKFYQKYISPLKSTKCPYIPTCSQYGLEAIHSYKEYGYELDIYIPSKKIAITPSCSTSNPVSTII